MADEEKPDESPAEELTQDAARESAPTETPAETPTETPTETPAETPAETPTDAESPQASVDSTDAGDADAGASEPEPPPLGEAPADPGGESTEEAAPAAADDAPPAAADGAPETAAEAEKQIASELGIGTAGKVEIDQSVIDELLGDAVIGYEEIFRDTALEAGAEGGAAVSAVRSTDSGSGEDVIDHNLRLMRDVNMKVKVELGRGEMYLKDILMLGQGSVVELERLAGDPLDIYVNDKVIARGEVLVLNENFCIRITEIHNPAETVKHGI